jgi:sugar/nucleoside kinase (ribokinase family)
MSAVRSDGERFFLTFLGHQKSFSTKPQMPQIIDTVDKGDIVHISGYYMLPRLKAELPQLLRRLRERGTKVSYDPGWPPLGFAKSERKDLRAILAQVDFFEPNEAELLAMTGKTTILSAVNAIRHSFLGVIALKRGAKGSMIFSGRKQIVVEAFRVHPSNTTGAGDVFDAGFITGLVRNNSLDACARRGNAAAAIMMSKDKSDISRFPSKTTLDRLLKIR